MSTIEDVVAGLADAEIKRAGLADLGNGQHAMGEIFAQTFQIGAGHQRQTDLAGRRDSVRKLAETRAGCWRRLTSTYFHSAGGMLVDLVHQFDAGGCGQQDEAGKGCHGAGRMGRSGTIGSMNDSMAQPSPGLVRTDAPGWKSVLSWVSSLVLCALFLLSGLWKITDVQGTAVRMVQAKVPESLGLAAALFFGIVETVGAVMILVPRLRRWGAVVLGALLLAFLGYFAIQYNTLRGADCSCIPWLKRVVGPGFFVGDGVMLLWRCSRAWDRGARKESGRWR